MKIVAEQTRIEWTITRIDGAADLVTMQLRIERTLKNVSSSTVQTPPLLFDLEEWGYPGHPSQITVATARYRGQDMQLPTQPKGPKVVAKGDALPLAPGEEVSVVYVGSETKRCNDHYIMVFHIPTREPQFVVQAPPDIGCDMRPARPDKDLVRMGPGLWVLRATVLPYQASELRWWVKDGAPASAQPNTPTGS